MVMLMAGRKTVICGGDFETRGLYDRTFTAFAIAMQNPITKKICIHATSEPQKAREFLLGLTTNIQRKYIIFFHNLDFDFAILLELLRDKMREMQFVVRGSNLIQIKWRNIIFRDSLQFMNAPLRVLGDFVGVKKGVWEKAKKSHKTLLEYVKGDALILLLAILEFNRQLKKITGKNIWNYPTPASYAHASLFPRTEFRNFFVVNAKSGKFYSKFVKVVNLLIRNNFYFGGRTENFVFGHVRERIYKYDVNSLYPYVMFKYAGNFPLRPREIKLKKPENEQYLFIGKIRTDYHGFPPFCVRAPDKRLYFVWKPKGVVALWREEFEYLVEIGLIREWKGFFITFSTPTPQQARALQERIKKLYELKKNSSGFKRLAVKLLLNSSYGKFAQKHIQENISLLGMNPECLIYDYATKRRVPQLLWERNRETRYYKKLNYAIGAYITAMARLHMFKLLHYCFKERIDVYYMDTDSLLVNRILPGTFIGKELGELKLEDVYSEGYFLGAKNYAGFSTGKNKWDIHLKGFAITTLVEYLKINRGEIKKHVKNPARFKTWIKGKENYEIDKTIQQLIQKRKFQNMEIESNDKSEPYECIEPLKKLSIEKIWKALWFSILGKPPRLNPFVRGDENER